MLVHDLLFNAAARFPDKEALVHRGRRHSYADLARLAGKIRDWLLNTGQEPGFRAGILTDDPLDYITAYFGIIAAHGSAVGLNIQTNTRSLKEIFVDCGPTVLFVDRKFTRYLDEELLGRSSLAHVVSNISSPPDEVGQARWSLRHEILAGDASRPAEPLAVDTEAIAQIIYTSGTTGAPKGVMLRHRNLLANTESIITYLGIRESDRVMAVLPFFYSYGNSILLTHIARGATLVVNQSFLYPNLILDDMVGEGVTAFSGVPSNFAILLNRSSLAEYRFPALRYITQAGAAMSPAVARRLQEIFPGVDIFIMYGQTEASARLAYLSPEMIEKKSGSIGKAIPGVTLKLLDEQGQPVPPGETGEIVASGANIMAGYWGRPEATAEVLREQGLWTGDLARQDEDGFFYIVGRKSAMIKSGSHRIAPKEIEEIILEHPRVHEVAVAGVADEILGEVVKAWLVLRPGVACTVREIQIHCKRNLPAFKVPQEIEFISELPKTATGKIKIARLKDHG